MSDSIEILFESIPPGGVTDAVNDLLDGRQMKELYLAGGDVGSLTLPADVFSLLLGHGTSQALSFKVDEMNIDEARLLFPFVQIIRHEGGIDLSILVDRKAIAGDDFKASILSLQSGAVLFSERYGIENCICGLDPAVDIDTRYFTGRSLGPLLIKQ